MRSKPMLVRLSWADNSAKLPAVGCSPPNNALQPTNEQWHSAALLAGGLSSRHAPMFSGAPIKDQWRSVPMLQKKIFNHFTPFARGGRSTCTTNSTGSLHDRHASLVCRPTSRNRRCSSSTWRHVALGHARPARCQCGHAGAGRFAQRLQHAPHGRGTLAGSAPAHCGTSACRRSSTSGCDGHRRPSSRSSHGTHPLGGAPGQAQHAAHVGPAAA